MKHFKLNLTFLAISLCGILASCSKHNDTPAVSTPTINGLFVLNQGGITKGNSTLSFYDFTTKVATTDVFFNANNSVLGDTGNDIEVYGSKTYIVVNYSSTIQVTKTQSQKLIANVVMNDSKGNHRQPRNIVFYKSNAYITAYDGTVAVMDTATLTITKNITVGTSPEQEVISNGKLYVANSGGALYPNAENTVSVIDLTTQAEIKRVTVGQNPISLAVDAYNEIYVLAAGATLTGTNTYVPSSITVINTTTDVAAAPVLTDLAYASPIVISNDIAYYIGGDNKIKTYNVKTKASVSTGFITDGTTIAIPYALSVNDATGEIYVADAIDYTSTGTVYAFDKTGKKEYSFKVGINPGKILLIKN